MDSFDTLLRDSALAHGHLCPGQVVGVRMALLGCRLIGLKNPTHRDQIKKLIVFVEMDRCAADAIAHVTGVRLGRRSLKFMDYGIMAATFVNLESSGAYRVLSTEESRNLSDVYAPEIADPSTRQLEAYQRMPDNVLFRVQKVSVDIDECELPGPTRRKIACRMCGQVIRDGKELQSPQGPICRPCSGRCYFSRARDISWPGMDYAPENHSITFCSASECHAHNHPR